MDVESRRHFWRAVRDLAARAGAILLTTHYLEEADALATRIIVLNRGRIIADGPPAAIKRRPRPIVRCVPDSPVRRRAAMLPGVPADSAGRRRPADHGGRGGTARALLVQDATVSGLEVRSVGLEEASSPNNEHPGADDTRAAVA